MRNLPMRRLGLIFPLAALLLAGCVNTGPQATSTDVISGVVTPVPGSSVLASLEPGATLPPVIVPATTGATLPPTTIKTPKPPKTPKPTNAPTLPPTAPPTSAPVAQWPAGAISTTDAAGHIGETATVCGAVQFANWVFAEKGHPTWLNMDSAYPNVTFNAVIWGEQRRAYPLSGKPEVVYMGKTICVTGVIGQYKTWTQIQDLSKDTIQVIQ